MSILEDRTMMIFCCVVAAALGAVFGSFLNCAAWRIAHGESFLGGHSRCVHCGHDLGVLDLVPVLSWVFLRGRCRYCKGKVSVRYPLTELFFAALTVMCVLRFGLSVETLRNWIFLCCLFCLSLVDLDAYIIPDGTLIIAAAAWVVTLPFMHMGWGEIGLHVLAALIFGGGILGLSLVMDRILKKESLGGGDVKLFAVVGLYLGLVGTLFSVFFAAVFGLLFALVQRLSGKGGQAIPFGPSIAMAAAVILLYGDGLVNWYLGLLKL